MLLTETQVKMRLVRLVDEAGGQKAWANQHGLSASYVNDALNGRRSFGQKMIAAMGLKFAPMYEAPDE